ncbi:MAG: tRNA (adenosine(37)-N6)-threonylcarbamoyltransferase complex dimerization subunit type 1 TsaB [Chthoniobacterales bacterium]
MKILALETSTGQDTVAVADDAVIVAERSLSAPRGRGAQLYPLLAELRPWWKGADRLALGLGPGSYNGLRAACALAEAFQLALALEVVTAPSPCLLDVPETNYRVVGDARGGQVFFAEVAGRRLVEPVRLLPRDDFFRETTNDGGAPVYRVGRLEGAEELPLAVPSARVLALLAPELSPSSPESIQPIYLKPPHITLSRHDAPRLASPS